MTQPILLEEELTNSIIGGFYEVYRNLGHGLLEQLHLVALEKELRARGHTVVREFTIRIMYKGKAIGYQRLDMVVDDRVVIEAKSSEQLPQAAKRQLYNYLRCTNLEVGLLLHFGPRPGFYRFICENRLKPHGLISVKSVSSVRSASPPVDG